MNRRDFLQYASLTSLTGLMPTVLANDKTSSRKLSQSLQRPDRIVLMVELRGGNDGLNTLVPFEDELYYKLRPEIAIKKAIPLKGDMGINPYLRSLLNLWKEGDMAWVQGVGYPQASRSHFHSADIWESGNLSGHGDGGWVSQVFRDGDRSLNGIVLGDNNLGPMAGERGRSVAMLNSEEFLRQTKYLNKKAFRADSDALSHMLSVQNQINLAASLLEEKLKNARPSSVRFPNTAFGRHLEQVNRMIINGMHLPAYKVTLDGFDTHANQRDVHNNLMNHLSSGLSAFAKSMKHHKLWNNILVVTYSEFGRRVRENGSYGTDHGSGSVNMVLGGAIRGGLYGKTPSLKEDDLVNGDLAHSIDFREIYATIAQRWWKRPSPWGQAHKPVPFV
ncbi:MAG: hypothetical protein CSB47_03575 [Proteobacteria bacterium]|nr:MAG: hypothetical protein CSB47_03575 [Pseudomonadota bacterium]